MAIIFKELDLDLPEITVPKVLWDKEDASNEAFYTSAAIGGENPEEAYLKTNSDLVTKGFSDLRDLAVKTYEKDQSEQNKLIVNNIIDDPSLDKQDKKNALELYATGGYISSDLKKRYQSSIKNLTNPLNPIEEVEQIAAIEALDKENLKTNEAIINKTVEDVSTNIDTILVNEAIPEEARKIEVTTEVVNKIEKLITLNPDSEGVDFLKKLNTAIKKTPGTLLDTAKNTLDMAGFVTENLAGDAANIGGFVADSIKALLGFGYNISKSPIEYKANKNYINSLITNYDKIKEDIKIQNVELLKQNNTTLNSKEEKFLDNTLDTKLNLDLVKENSIKETKISVEYLQKLYNTSDKESKGWIKNANLAEERLATSEVMLENWNNLKQIVNTKGKNVFRVELETLQKEGIYSKHIIAALKPIHSAETTFGTNNEISATGAVGDLQVIYPTFTDLINQGYLGPLYVEAIDDTLATTVDELKKLTREEFTILFSNNPTAAILAGEAKLLQMFKTNTKLALKNILVAGSPINKETSGPTLEEWKKSWEEANGPVSEWKYGKNSIESIIEGNFQDSDAFLGITSGTMTNQLHEEVMKIVLPNRADTVTAKALTKFGEILHAAQEKVEEITPDSVGPASSRLIVEAILVLIPSLVKFAKGKQSSVPSSGRKKATEAQKKAVRAENARQAAANAAKDRKLLENPNWRAKYSTESDGPPIYATDQYSSKKNVNPESPIQASANANIRVAKVLSEAILTSPDGSVVNKALGVRKIDIWNSWGQFDYGNKLTLGGSVYPDMGRSLDMTSSDISAREIYGEYLENKFPFQAYEATGKRLLITELNNLATNQGNNYSSGHSQVRLQSDSITADLSFRADSSGIAIATKKQATDILNKLIDDPSLGNIKDLNTDRTLIRNRQVKSRKEKSTEIIPFVQTQSYIINLKTGKKYYTEKDLNKDRSLMSTGELIEAGPDATVSITIPSYNKKVLTKNKSNKGLTFKTETEVIPEMTIDIAVTKGKTGKYIDLKLPDGSTKKRYVAAFLRRTSKGNPYEIMIDVDYISKAFVGKPWLSPKIIGINPLPDIFKSPNEWVDFVMKHEIAHANNPRNLKAESLAEYENRINNIALKEYTEQFNKTNSHQLEVILEVRTDFDPIAYSLTPITTGPMAFNFAPGQYYKYFGNTRMQNWDIFSWLLGQQRSPDWMSREIITKGLENDYLSSRMQNELVNTFISYKNKDALVYLLEDMNYKGLSIDAYTNADLFNMFGTLINDPKILDMTKIKSVKDLEGLREAANAYENLSMLERRIKNGIEIDRLVEEGYDLGIYENISNDILFDGGVTDQVFSKEGKPLILEVAKNKNGIEVIENVEITIPWIVTNIKKVLTLDEGRIVDFNYSKELSLANGKGQIVDTEGKILVRLSKKQEGPQGRDSLEEVWDIKTEKPLEEQNFYNEKKGFETYPDLPSIESYQYALINPTSSRLRPLAGELIPIKKGYLPALDTSNVFIDIAPLKAKENGVIIYDYLNGKIDPISKRKVPVTIDEVRTSSMLQLYSSTIARAKTKQEANAILKTLENSGLYPGSLFYVREAIASNPKEMFNYANQNQLLYEAELATAKQKQESIVGGGTMEDIGTAIHRLARNELKQGLFAPGYKIFKTKFVEEYRDFLQSTNGEFPTNVNQIGQSNKLESLTKEQKNKLNAAKNQYEDYIRRIGVVETGFSDIAKQRFLHSVADIIEGTVNVNNKLFKEMTDSLRKEANDPATSAMLLQRTISTILISGSPIKQILLQTSPALEVLGFAPTKIPKLISSAILLRTVAVLDHPSLSKGKLFGENKIIAGLKAVGWTDKEVFYLIREVKKALSQVDKNILVSEVITQSDPKLQPNPYDKTSTVGKGVIGAPGTLGRIIGFKQSESITKVMSILFGVETFKERNPGVEWWTDKNRGEVAANGYRFSGSMTKLGAMPWSHNSMGQLATFLQYNHKVMVELLHKDGFGLNDAQRGRLFLAKAAMWGPENVPLWGFYAAYLTEAIDSYLRAQDEEKFNKFGAQNPAALANEASKKRWYNKMESGVMDWLWKSAFKVAGQDAPSGSVLAEGMSTRQFGLIETAMEIYKLFDGDSQTTPSIPSLQVPGKIMEAIKTIDNIWSVPDSSNMSTTTTRKMIDTLRASLKNYKTINDIEKAIIIKADDYWIKDKNGKKLYQINESDRIQIMMGWGDPKGQAYWNDLIPTLTRKSLVEDVSKLLWQSYIEMESKYSQDKNIPETMSNLENNMPWLLEYYHTPFDLTKKELNTIKQNLFSYDKQRAGETGEEQLFELHLKQGISESEKNRKETGEYIRKYFPDADYEMIFNPLLDN